MARRRKSLDETIQDSSLSAVEKRFLKGSAGGKKDKKQLTVEIDQDVYDQFQLKCLQRGTKMAKVVREAIEEFLRHD